MMMTPGDQGPRPGVRIRRPFEPVEWPDYLPPFLYAAVQIDPSGILWVHRTTDAGAPELFDLVDRLGNVVGQVQTPTRTRIVGFGRAHVYLVRLDADHQEFLERYPMPTLARPPRAP